MESQVEVILDKSQVEMFSWDRILDLGQLGCLTSLEFMHLF